MFPSTACLVIPALRYPSFCDDPLTKGDRKEDTSTSYNQDVSTTYNFNPEDSAMLVCSVDIPTILHIIHIHHDTYTY